MGPGGAPRAGFGGPAPRLGAGPDPRGDLRALGGVRAGGRGGPAVARSVQARSASVSYSRSGSFSHGMAGGDTVMVQPTPLEPMPAMPMAARTMAIIPIATATRSTGVTDAFWFATSGRDGPLTREHSGGYRKRLGFVGARDGAGSLTAVARRRSGPWRCVSVCRAGWEQSATALGSAFGSECEAGQNPTTNVGAQSVAARACERACLTR